MSIIDKLTREPVNYENLPLQQLRSSDLLRIENVACEQCGSLLGFIPELVEMRAFTKAPGGVWDTKPVSTKRYKPCRN